jgi:hypothetical protein
MFKKGGYLILVSNAVTPKAAQAYRLPKDFFKQPQTKTPPERGI